MGNLTIASNHHIDGMVATNEDVFEENLTVLSNKNSIIAGPVTIPNVTINTDGNLNVINDLNVTGILDISGTLNLTG
tara:strand:+ start:8 stop:238 length:231 start_codon:yes stop_codon:yes gene_type:complete